jgi:hypothetical protein
LLKQHHAVPGRLGELHSVPWGRRGSAKHTGAGPVLVCLCSHQGHESEPPEGSESPEPRKRGRPCNGSAGSRPNWGASEKEVFEVRVGSMSYE